MRSECSSCRMNNTLLRLQIMTPVIPNRVEMEGARWLVICTLVPVMTNTWGITVQVT